MCRSFLATGHSCGLRSKDKHISTGPANSGCPYRPVSHESSEAALVPLREQGVRILNYHRTTGSYWLSLQDQLCEHRDLVLSHLSQLGLRVNWEKRKRLPMQRISFLSMELGFGQSDSAPPAGTRSGGVELLNTFKNRTAAQLKTVSEAPWA